MITIQIVDDETQRSSVALIPSIQGPSLRSALTKFRNDQGELASGAYRYEKEDAQTRAMSGLGAFAAALNRVILEEDAEYE